MLAGVAIDVAGIGGAGVVVVAVDRLVAGAHAPGADAPAQVPGRARRLIRDRGVQAAQDRVAGVGGAGVVVRARDGVAPDALAIRTGVVLGARIAVLARVAVRERLVAAGAGPVAPIGRTRVAVVAARAAGAVAGRARAAARVALVAGRLVLEREVQASLERNARVAGTRVVVVAVERLRGVGAVAVQARLVAVAGIVVGTGLAVVDRHARARAGVAVAGVGRAGVSIVAVGAAGANARRASAAARRGRVAGRGVVDGGKLAAGRGLARVGGARVVVRAVDGRPRSAFAALARVALVAQVAVVARLAVGQRLVAARAARVARIGRTRVAVVACRRAGAVKVACAAGAAGRARILPGAREAAEDPRAPLTVGLAAPAIGAGDDLVRAVAVEVAGSRDRPAERRAREPGGRRLEVGLGHETRGVAEVHGHAPFVRRFAVPAPRADDDIVLAVAVDVSGARDRLAEVGAGEVDRIRRPGGRRAQARRAAEVEVRAAFRRRCRR